MLPSFNLFGIDIAMYGLMIVIGLAVGIGLAVLRTKRYGQKGEDTLYAAIFAVLGLAVGAKLLYILTILPDLIANFSVLVEHPAKAVSALLSGGFVFYGGLIGAVFGLWVYTRLFKLDFWNMTDILIPSVPLIHAFGRIGCFCAGCCYGMPAPPPFGVSFDASPVAPHGVTLFPVQLAEAFLNLIIFAALMLYARKPRGHGQIIGLYMAAYAAVRFCLEFVRYDAARGSIWGLSTSQWISLILFPIGIYLLFFRCRRRQAKGRETA